MKSKTIKPGGKKGKDDPMQLGMGSGREYSNAQMKFNALVDAAKKIPALKASDEDIGIGGLSTIMPDTWNNISWAIANPTEILRDTLH